MQRGSGGQPSATKMSFMARDLVTMFRDALELSESDRARLAGLLIERHLIPRSRSLDGRGRASLAGDRVGSRADRPLGRGLREVVSQRVKRVRFHREADQELMEARSGNSGHDPPNMKTDPPRLSQQRVETFCFPVDSF